MLKKYCSALVLSVLLAASGQAHAAKILFAHVGNYGAYVDDGNRIRDFLSNAGHDVDTVYLNQAVYNNYNTYDQVFVYDLYSSTDQTATQVANYLNIAAWYNGLTDKNLILDGRIISSDVVWTDWAGMSSEELWIQNYATQLDLRGGGLVLGTDHATDFTRGINNINQAIGVGEFSGFYQQYPYQSFVDPNSPLYIPTLDVCTTDPLQQCINDNSSTSNVATGLQVNGQVLTPVAYHGTTSGAWNLASVSSTMGSLTFGTCGGANQPPCDVPEPASIALLGLGIAALGFRRRRRFA